MLLRISCWVFDDGRNIWSVAQSISLTFKVSKQKHYPCILVCFSRCFSLSNYNQITLVKCMFSCSKTRSHPSYSKGNIFFSQSDHKQKIADRQRQLAIYRNRPIYNAGYILAFVYRLLTRCDCSWGQLLKPVRLVSAVYNHDRPGSRKDSWV